MNINGCITAIIFYGIFCGFNKVNLSRTIFKNCKIGMSTILNDKLIDINNYEENKIICNTNYFVTFKDYLYPEYIYKLYNIKYLLDNKTILYELFNCILTFKQIKKLALENIDGNSDNQIVYKLKQLFLKKGNNLKEDEKII